MRLFDVVSNWIERKQGSPAIQTDEHVKVVENSAHSLIVSSWWSQDAAVRLIRAAERASERLREL